MCRRLPHKERCSMRCQFTACALIVLSALGRSGAESRSMSAVYAHQSLSLAIPYEAARSGDAELKVEVLSPENKVLGHTERAVHVEQGREVWNTAVSLMAPMPEDEVIWQRLRFTLRYEGDGAPAVDQIRSISTILRRPVLHILAQKTYIAGAAAAMRVIVSNAS